MSEHSSEASDRSLSSLGFEERRRGWGFEDEDALLGPDEEQQEPLGIAARGLLWLGLADVSEKEDSESVEEEEEIEEQEDTKMSSSKMTSHTEDCLGGEVPLGTARTINEAVASFCGLPKKERMKLNPQTCSS